MSMESSHFSYSFETPASPPQSLVKFSHAKVKEYQIADEHKMLPTPRPKVRSQKSLSSLNSQKSLNSGRSGSTNGSRFSQNGKRGRKASQNSSSSGKTVSAFPPRPLLDSERPPSRAASVLTDNASTVQQSRGAASSGVSNRSVNKHRPTYSDSVLRPPASTHTPVGTKSQSTFHGTTISLDSLASANTYHLKQKAKRELLNKIMKKKSGAAGSTKSSRSAKSWVHSGGQSSFASNDTKRSMGNSRASKSRNTVDRASSLPRATGSILSHKTSGSKSSFKTLDNPPAPVRPVWSNRVTRLLTLTLFFLRLLGLLILMVYAKMAFVEHFLKQPKFSAFRHYGQGGADCL